jgi:exopolyphosphatase/guanosine-5'-triphosphate,3'-diphosphate pyrophosphatase
MTVGRWEWRGFDADIEVAATRLGELTPESVEESDELYLLSTRSEASVKVRDGLLDVKRLVQVSSEGLQQWLPVAKDAFPNPAENLVAALAELGVDVSLARERYALDELLLEVVPSCPDLHLAEVHKTRRRLTLGGCMAELTDVVLRGRATRTVAV